MSKKKTTRTAPPSVDDDTDQDPILDQMDEVAATSDEVAGGGLATPDGMAQDGTTISVSAEPAPELGIQVTVELPMCDLPDNYAGYLTRRIDVVGMSARQALNLKRLMRGLEDEHATLENGAAVRNPSDAIKFVLESL